MVIKMMNKIINSLSNDYLMHMLFAFMLLVIIFENTDVIVVQVVISIIAVAIAFKPLVNDYEGNKVERIINNSKGVKND